MGLLGTGPALPENYSPKRGDVYIVGGDRGYYCPTDGLWEAFGSYSTAASRIYYDTLIFGTRYYPLTEGAVTTKNRSAAPRVVDDWSQFEDCRWLITNYTTHETFEEFFPTITDMVDWINANIPHGGSPDTFDEFDVKPFDVTDGDVPVIERMYGYNNAYAGMKGGHYKASFPNHMGNGGNYQNVFNAIWGHFFPTLAPFFGPADFNTEARGRNACWCPRNYTKMYAMPKRGELVIIGSTPSGASFRQSANENWEGFTNVNAADGYLNILDRAAVLVSPGGTTWNIVNNFGNTGLKSINRWMLDPTENNSGLIAYSLRGDGGGPGDRQLAVYIKPLGIDTIRLPYFDNTKYDMEVTYSLKQEVQPSYFRKIAWPEFLNVHPSSGLQLRKSNWFPGALSRYANMVHQNHHNRMKIYFRLRDKVTKRVGHLSPAHIELRLNETNAPTKFMVRQDRFS